MNREATNGVAALNILCHSANWSRFVRHSMHVFVPARGQSLLCVGYFDLAIPECNVYTHIYLFFFKRKFIENRRDIEVARYWNACRNRNAVL